MRIRVIAVGTRMPDWVTGGVDTFTQRMPPECRVEFVEIPVAPRGKNADIARLRAAEGARMLKLLSAQDLVIALDERGKPWTTVSLAADLADWLGSGRDVALLIGGPDGLDPACRQRAERTVSISGLTLPHAMVRLILAEALYRAWTVHINHPYHRA
jgi:23S rRNA (pseudouridine1915-N3)-methyltransferase